MQLINKHVRLLTGSLCMPFVSFYGFDETFCDLFPPPSCRIHFSTDKTHIGYSLEQHLQNVNDPICFGKGLLNTSRF